MRSVLIAGISGNLGTNLARNLSKEGFIVFGLSRTTNPPNSPFIKRMYSNNDISKAFKNNQIDYVINAACCYGRAKENDYEILEGNFFFQITLLKHAINFSSKFINIASVVHPNANLYGYTKDIFTDSLKRIGKLNLDFSYLNIFLENIYGPNESKDKFIKSMILKLKNDHVIYLSKGWQKRDFLYITDAVEGITQTIVNFEKLQGNLNIILGSGFSITVRELTNKLKKISMSKASLIFDGSKQEPTRLINRGKYPKLQELIDWEPKISLFQGLSKYEY
jgi:nucleoside-diphosphate-sugar epimerase